MFSSNRSWWIASGAVVLLILVLLGAIVRRQSGDWLGSDLVPGDSEIIRARVVQVLQEGVIGQAGFEQPYQRLQLQLSQGSLKGQEIEVEQGTLGPTSQSRLFRAGDQVFVQRTLTVDGSSTFVIADYVRTGPLLWLTMLFVAATLLLSGWQGVRSLVGMAISLVVIVSFVVPQILSGHDPVLTAVLGSLVMMGISLYLVYGWTPKCHVAVVSLFLSLVLTGLLAIGFVGWARLAGFGAEEVGFLQVAGVQLDTQGLLLAGIMIGRLGALDDIAIGQSSAIFELNNANPSLRWQALFRHGMVIGRDHIAAMVNTLLLAYAGAALPLLLMFSVYSEPLGATLNREIVAEEIVRTLVGSLGLLACVPLTSLIAALTARHSRGERRVIGQAS
jgi:uncharacterized membrane protein